MITFRLLCIIFTQFAYVPGSEVSPSLISAKPMVSYYCMTSLVKRHFLMCATGSKPLRYVQTFCLSCCPFSLSERNSRLFNDNVRKWLH